MKTILTAVFAVVMGMSALADSWGRYGVVGSYETDETEGVRGVYFQMVAEQGSSTPAYAVIGGVYPLRASQSLNGNVVIPETVLGVPVRKVADGAFIAQTQLKSIVLPAGVREIGDRAFAWCTSLTSVTFAGAGVRSIGESCFSNCISLVSVEFPDSLEYIAPNAFALCDQLETVTFEGNAPMLDVPWRDTQVSYFGEKRWTGGTAPRRAVFRVKSGTYGWNGPYKCEIPDRWPLSHGFMNAHPVETYGASHGSLPLAGTNFVFTTVTNVVNTRETLHTYETVTNIVHESVTNVVNTKETLYTYATVTNQVHESVTNFLFSFSIITNVVRYTGDITNVVEHFTTVTNVVKYVPESGTSPEEIYRAKAGVGTGAVIAGAMGYDAFGLPNGMAWEAGSGTLSGTPTRSGVYDIMLVGGSGENTKIMRTQVAVDGFEPIVGYVGTDFAREGLPLSIFADRKTWPGGLRWDAKNEKLAGVPSKAGDFSRTTIDGEPVTFEIKALPACVVGTFNGALVEGLDPSAEVGASALPVEVTVTTGGRLSAKVTNGAKTTSFTAKSFAAWTKSGGGVSFTAQLSSVAGDVLTMTVRSTDDDWTDWTMIGEYRRRGVKNSMMPEVGDGWSFAAQRNAFGKIGKMYENESAHAAITGIVGKTQCDSTRNGNGVWLLMPVATTLKNMVAVTIKEDGKATLSGRLSDGTSVSCTSMVVFDDKTPIVRFYVKGTWIVW